MILIQPASHLRELPASPGVYRFSDKNSNLLYIGKAKNLSQRVKAYFEGREHGPHIRQMVLHIHQLEVITTATELEALLLEQRLIAQHKPKYNIIFRDDKTYAYIALTHHKYPQIKSFRGKRTAQQDLYGPYVDSRASKARIELIQKTFKIRSCDDTTYANRSRPCVLHQIGRCSGPCVAGLISDKDYADNASKAKSYLAGHDAALIVAMTHEMSEASACMAFERAAQLRDQIKSLSSAATLQNMEARNNANVDAIGLSAGAKSTAILLFEVREGIVRDVYSYVFDRPLTPTEAYEALFSQHYIEHKPPARIVISNSKLIATESLDFIAFKWGFRSLATEPLNAAESGWLKQAQANAEQNIAHTETSSDARKLQQRKLSELFPLFPGTGIGRIECFDISHFQAEAPVASCVVYDDFAMRHEKYRLFNISPEHSGDDFASMKEVIIRRYQNARPEDFPDLIIIDGGKGQLTKAREALALIKLDIPLLGIAKGPTRKLGQEELICSWGDPSLKLDKSHPALLLLSHIRDESHRFAITRNRKKTTAKRTQSQLLQIPGIGQAKRKALMLSLGSTSNISSASVEQLAQVPGIGVHLAAEIKHFYELSPS